MRGSTRKRGTTWTCYWDVINPSTGDRQQKSKGGFTRQKDAEAYLDTVLVTVRDGTYVEPSKQSLSAFMVEEWLPAIAGTVRPATLDQYRSVTRRYIEPRTIGTIPLRALSASHINALYAELEGLGLAVNTRRTAHTVLSRCMSDAVRWDKIKRNPAKLADPPAMARRRAQAWSARELRQFLRVVEHDRLYPLWRLGATTGMRRGELAGLQWLTVDLEGGRLRIERQLLRTLDYGPPKSRHSERTIALDSGTVDALRRHRDAQRLERSLAGDLYEDSDLVFCDELGRRIDPARLTEWFAKHRQAAGIPTGTLHILRHTAATIALTEGVPLHIVAARLGDKPETLLAVYAHLLPKSDEIAADTIAAAILVDKPLTDASESPVFIGP